MTVQMNKAIVIGASSGIGEAIARQLAQGGTTVAIVARRVPDLQRIAKTMPDKLRPYQHDVQDVDAVSSLFERIVKDLGGLDTVVYAAGAMPTVEEGEYSFDKDRTMVAVNLLGAMAWLNPTAARFEAQRAGTIVGISRGHRHDPGPKGVVLAHQR